MILPEGALMCTHISSAYAFVSTFQVRNYFPSRVHRGRVCKLSVQPVELAGRYKAERYATRVAVNVP
jgi:hypothetical protein